jgi:hypothetical protein
MGNGPQLAQHQSHKTTYFGNFFYIFYHDFAKIYGPPQILQNYTSAAVAHDVRDIMPWPTAVGAASIRPLVWDRHSVVPHSVRGLALWATVLLKDRYGEPERGE